MLRDLTRMLPLSPDGEAAGGAGETDVATDSNVEVPKFDAEQWKDSPEFKALLEKERTAAGTAGAKTAYDKAEIAKKKELEDAKKQWDADSKLSEEQREKKRQEEYKSQLDAKEQEINRRERKIEAYDMLAEKKLDPRRADMLVGKTKEETQANIDAYYAALSEDVARLAKADKIDSVKTPRQGDTVTTKPADKDLREIMGLN